MALIFDLVIHAAKLGRARAIDRYAKAARFPSASDEAQTLEAMRRTQFSVWQIARRRETTGVVVAGLLRDKETWLADEALTHCAQVGLAFAGRLLWPAAFAMTCGVVVPVDAELIEEALFDGTARLRHADPEQLADDPRFAATIYRTALDDGIMDHVTYQEITPVS